MIPIMTFGQRQQAMQGLPFYGRSDFNFAAAKSPFSNGISIKILPLSDLSRVNPVNIDSFGNEINRLSQEFKRGSRISGVKVNSTFTNAKKEPTVIVGKFESLKIDKDTQTIRAFIRDPKSLKIVEVYPETLNRLTESRNNQAKTFIEFLIQ
jgi:hypothetical protein